MSACYFFISEDLAFMMVTEMEKEKIISFQVSSYIC